MYIQQCRLSKHSALILFCRRRCQPITRRRCWGLSLTCSPVILPCLFADHPLTCLLSHFNPKFQFTDVLPLVIFFNDSIVTCFNIPRKCEDMGFRPHTPSFGYAVSRPYPYKWFSWVVIVIGYFATVIFSFINIAASGYKWQ